MRPDTTNTIGAILGISAGILLVIALSQGSFPVMEYATQNAHYIDTSGNVGQEYSSFLWSSRSIDLVAQAFAIFAAAAGCLAMLRVGLERGGK